MVHVIKYLAGTALLIVAGGMIFLTRDILADECTLDGGPLTFRALLILFAEICLILLSTYIFLGKVNIGLFIAAFLVLSIIVDGGVVLFTAVLEFFTKPEITIKSEGNNKSKTFLRNFLHLAVLGILIYLLLVCLKIARQTL